MFHSSSILSWYNLILKMMIAGENWDKIKRWEKDGGMEERGTK